MTYKKLCVTSILVLHLYEVQLSKVGASKRKKMLITKRSSLFAVNKMKNSITNRLGIFEKHLSSSFVSADITNVPSQITNISQGAKYTSSYKNYALSSSGKVISYFHDIPLEINEAEKTVNMVVEIPRWSNAKFEINTSMLDNPITQDVKNNKPRFVKNIFPYKGYIHNYGAIPQTWEDPTKKNADVGLIGDGDPLDVCEIGSQVLSTGDVKKVKVLGSLALIDDGELDWKIIVVDINDELASELYEIHDVFVKCPGLLESTRQWFRDYKLPDGKPKNEFAFNGIYKGQEETLEIIKECHESWKSLINGDLKHPKILTSNRTLVGTPGYLGDADLLKFSLNSTEEGSIDPEISKVYYYSSD